MNITEITEGLHVIDTWHTHLGEGVVVGVYKTRVRVAYLFGICQKRYLIRELFMLKRAD